MKKILITSFSTIGIICVLYYSVKFYLTQELIFKQASILEWSIICLLIVICLMIGILNTFKLNNLEKQNDELKDLLLETLKNQKSNHFSQLHQVQNSQEISLDILTELRKDGVNNE